MKLNTKKIGYLISAIIIASLIFGGGYFIPTSVICLIPLLVIINILLFKSRSIKISFDINFISVLLLSVFYLVTTLWAIDKGTALIGFVKFIPVLFLLIALYYVDSEIENIIQLLPYLGTIMTILSFLMMQFKVYKPYVEVAGRLSGFFQYPNTYALFLLVCIVVSSFNLGKGQNRINIINIAVACFGIYLSGSRIVFAMSVFYAVYFVLKNRNGNKMFFIGFFVLVAILFVFMIFIGNNKGITHILSTNLSTLWGRLLYYRDGVLYILKHPFGVGYLGYAFVQYEFQTGVYTVLNIHNELLQLMLDIGWVPAILFYVAIIRSIFSKTIKNRNRVVLIIIAFHSLLDFDFQFISIMFILLLFLENKEIKEYKISVFTKFMAVFVTVLLSFISIKIGTSEFYNITKKYDKAIEYYDGNTIAKTNKLKSVPDDLEVESLAKEIIEGNKHVPMAYNALARACFLNGDIEGYIKNKDIALKLSPYSFEEYEEYVEVMYYCCLEYKSMNDFNSAKMCAQKLNTIPDILNAVEEKTSKLGWMIRDIPRVRLSSTQIKMIEEAQKEIYE